MLASWSLSLRLEHEAAAVARSYDLAGAVDTAASRLHDSVVCAGLAAGAMRLTRYAGTRGPGLPDRGTDGPVASGSAAGQGRTAGTDCVAAAGGSAGLKSYWHAEANATRQLDTLGTLALEPGLDWLAVPLGGLRDAVLSQMTMTDEALRHTNGAGGLPGDLVLAPSDDNTGLLVAALVDQVEERRRDLVARSLAAASLDRGRLVAVAAIGTVLLSALALTAPRRRPGVPIRAAGRPSVAEEPVQPSSAGRPDSGALADPCPPPSSGQAAPGLRILLVEDNAMVRFSLETMLSDLGHTVAAAGDAAGAMGLAETNPDVLVTDLGLPDLDGLTLAGRLRALRPSLRVVIASGHPGCAPDMVWLQKPFDLDRLRRAVEASAARTG